MKVSIRDISLVFIITFILLFLIELVSTFALSKEDLPFLIDLRQNTLEAEKLKGYGFDEIHPLLGWKMSTERMENEGYRLEHDIIVLESSETSCENPLQIYISGGSTTDVALDHNNWPIALKALLDSKQLCYKIYVGAVGGYNSGQEFLKLIADLDKDIKVDVHISYSGANEFQFPNLVSWYENDFYQKKMQPETSKILPNTVFLLKKIKSKQEPLRLSEISLQNPSFFWLSNMKKMQAIALYNNYTFHGVLQPVFSYSGIQRDYLKEVFEERDYENSGYNSFYPTAKKACLEEDFLLDLTNTFAPATENVFIDDCHLKQAYQKDIAFALYQNILKDLFNPSE